MHWCSIAIRIGLVVFALLLTADAQDTSRLLGVVVDQANHPVTGAVITIRPVDPMLRDEFTGVTDSVGTFVAFVESGEHTIRIVKTDFAPFECRILTEDGLTRETWTLEPSIWQESVVVAATRRPRPTRVIPSAISELGLADIDLQGVSSRSLVDLLGKTIPGLAPGTESPSIFGQTMRGRPMLVLVDGVPQSTMRDVSMDLWSIDTKQLDRIEIIRGTSALYGDGSTGGIVNMSTRAPRGASAIRVNLAADASISHPRDSVGSTARIALDDAHGPFSYIFSAGLRCAGVAFDAKGDRNPPDPHGQGGIDDSKINDWLTKISFTGSGSRFTVTASRYASEQDSDYRSDTTVNLQPPGMVKSVVRRGLELATPPMSDNQFANIEYVGDLGSIGTVQTQFYCRRYAARFFPFDGRAYPVFGRYVFQPEIVSTKTGGRLTLESCLPTILPSKLITGCDLQNESSWQPVIVMDTVAFEKSSGLEFTPVSRMSWVPSVGQRGFGVFSDLETVLNNRFVTRAGIRKEQASVAVEDFTNLSGGEVHGGTVRYAVTLGHLGMTLGLRDTVKLFGQYSQGFAVPDVGKMLRAAPANASVKDLAVAAQKVNMVEVGATLTSLRTRVTISTFLNTSDLGSSPGGFSTPIVRAPERVYGVEIDGEARFTQSARVGGSFTWIEGESKATESSSYRPLNGFRIFPPKLVTFVERKFAGTIQVRMQSTTVLRRNRFAGSTAFGERAVCGYTTVDAVARFGFSTGAMTVGVSNLLNADYFPVKSQLLWSGANDSHTQGAGTRLTVEWEFYSRLNRTGLRR